MSRPFEAEYAGKCGGCGDGIAEGDVVRYVNDVLVHRDCYPVFHPDQSHRLPPTVCPRCHLTQPCEHDE